MRLACDKAEFVSGIGQGGRMLRVACCVKQFGLARTNGTHNTQHGTRNTAFTLLELLIAVVAFAIVLAAINGVFYSGLKLRNRSAASLEKSLPLAQALLVLKRDLANLAPPSTNETRLIGELQSSPTGTGSSSGSGPSSQPRFGSLAGATGGMSGQTAQVSPDFYTLSGLLDTSSPWPNVQKVAYLLVDSTNRSALGKDLIRAVTRNLLPAGGFEEVPAEQLLLTDVEDVFFLYHDGTDWVESWDSTADDTMKLPRAIKVQIQLAAETRASQSAPVELVVPIVVEASTNSTSQSSGGGR
jgi:prepilin-type N-terminal cleavage/methylation domain-containing protein